MSVTINDVQIYVVNKKISDIIFVFLERSNYFQMGDSTSSSVLSASASVLNKDSPPNLSNHFGKYVKLNVGNHLFLTSFDTLMKEDTMFKAMFSGRMEVVQDSEGMRTSFC